MSDTCGYTIVRDGEEEPCGRPVTGYRWYQDVEHEDCLEVACAWHENEGGNRMHAAESELDRLRAEVQRLNLVCEDWRRKYDGWRDGCLAAEAPTPCPTHDLQETP